MALPAALRAREQEPHDAAVGQACGRAVDARIGDETSHEVVVHVPLSSTPRFRQVNGILRARNSRKQALYAKVASVVAFEHQLRCRL